MVSVLNGGALALMTSVGHQVGLFDAMANAAAEHQRGHRRRGRRPGALCTRVAGRDDHRTRGRARSSAGTYWLPAEHAACLTRAAGPDNLAHLMQFVPMLAGVEQEVVECFDQGGGVPYSAYPRFHRADGRGQRDRARCGVGRWHSSPGARPDPSGCATGIDVADVGCGQGHAVNLMARAFPHSRFTGYDFSDEAIAAARDEAAGTGLTNATFELRDVTELGVTDAYDLVTAFDAIHDQAHPARVLAGIASALATDGVFLMVDIKASSHPHENLDLPWAPLLYTLSTMHCMTVSLALDGAGLGTVWGEQVAVAMLGDAGFSHVEVKEFETDPFNNYYVATRG